MSELNKLEKLYDVNIQVYSLAPTHNHGEEDDQENAPDIAATLCRRSHRDYDSTLYLKYRNIPFAVLLLYPNITEQYLAQNQ